MSLESDFFEHFGSLLERVEPHSDTKFPVFLTAVSGGLDSTVLFRLVHKFSVKFKCKQVLLHVDHGLRITSDRDSLHIQQEALKFSIPCLFVSLPAMPNSENMEAWARTKRYNALESNRVSLGADWILTGHHLDDQAETMIDRLISGRLLSDLNCIEESSKSRNLLRPLLPFSRKELEKYAEAEGFSWVRDESNDDLNRRRNLLRKKVIPFIDSEAGVDSKLQIAKFVQRTKFDEEYLEELAEKQCPDSLTRDYVLNTHAALAWRILRIYAVRGVGLEARKIGYQRWQKLITDLSLQQSIRDRDLGFGIYFEDNDDSQSIEFKLRTDSTFSKTLPLSCPLNIPDLGLASEFCDLGFVFDISISVLERKKFDFTGEFCLGSYREFFDLEYILARSLVIRTVEDGDRMKVWKRGTRKLKKLFQENSIPPEKRGAWPVVADVNTQDILWVPGIARGEFGAVSDFSKPMACLEAKISN